MAQTAVTLRSYFFSKSKSSSFQLFSRLFFRSSTLSPLLLYPVTPSKIHESVFPPLFHTRPFCTPAETPTPFKRNPKLVNFSLPSDSESDSESGSSTRKTEAKQIDKPKLPPPYDPFNKKPIIEEPDDPKNLQEVFAKLREDGLMNSAVKMFDGLSQEGLTHEALELFSQIKDKGKMPDVVAHTAVIEAYMQANQPKEAHKVYMRMLASGVLPNAYTYRVLIRGLAESGEVQMVKEAKKYFGEMVGRGMRPNAVVCVASFEGLVKVGLEKEGTEMLEMLKEKGIVPEESKVREALKNKRGTVYRTVMSVFYGK
ncbi:pentatricopeptide repeat-containing protein At4g38150-like [Olea europaea var. sylvestris]|uniref:pentatricopeptide repeat-containing protein At4g38150-like n=1 Tax=Olea europaea var. sylvestris TaxID=158386 RepID=UPI000C1CD909|nr:pentatricopeptide repeat-containing protein At4g38150-like [Olea europaea var. sylvestris]